MGFKKKNFSYQAYLLSVPNVSIKDFKQTDVASQQWLDTITRNKTMLDRTIKPQREKSIEFHKTKQ